MAGSRHARPTNHRRDEGPGGLSGIVLDMNMIGDGFQQCAYTVPVTVGAANAQYHLAVDTGSADMWIASNGCKSDPCSSAGAPLYNPASAAQTGKTFSIQYLSGAVSGPIVWDSVSLGGYSINTQALASATTVESEDLSSGFVGLIGLAFEADSYIAKEIPPTTTNSPDGAPLWSNIFGTAPNLQRFFSFTLQRPGMTTISSFLGIGRHPDFLQQNASSIVYTPVVQSGIGATFWRVAVQAVTVYVNGNATVLSLGASQSVAGSSSLVAVFDTGGPSIVATRPIANAIYGAWGVTPASDGNYYLPCSVMLNVSITIAGHEFPIHPLDLDYSTDLSSDSCTGAIEAPPLSAGPGSLPGDIILGIPFLRNVYTVLSFATVSQGATASQQQQSANHPQIGLLSLTDSSQAVAQWNQVRIQGISLGDSNPNTKSPSSGPPLSVGLEVLIGILGFFALCGTLFALRWFTMRRHFAAEEAAAREKGFGIPMSPTGKYRDSRSLGDSKWVFPASKVEESTTHSASAIPLGSTGPEPQGYQVSKWGAHNNADTLVDSSPRSVQAGADFQPLDMRGEPSPLPSSPSPHGYAFQSQNQPLLSPLTHSRPGSTSSAPYRGSSQNPSTDHLLLSSPSPYSQSHPPPSTRSS